MDAILIFLSLAVLYIGSYLIWPSRYNIMTHLSIGGVFIALYVPAMIVKVQEQYPLQIVSLYIQILTLGAVFYTFGMFWGYNIKTKKTKILFDWYDDRLFEKRIIKITKLMLIISIVGLSISYLVMGFVPMFASNPLAAKFFRPPYRDSYLRVASLYRSSFYILSTIIPIAAVIYYRYKQGVFLLLTMLGILLMILSLSRSPAFSGLLLALAVIMSVKSKFQFRLFIIFTISAFVLSSAFYFVLGINDFESGASANSENYWNYIAASSPDISDQLYFLQQFSKMPLWTFGRTLYGGLIPGHYIWSPTVYTIRVILPDTNIDEVISGGLRLPTPIWGYVSFSWAGVILYSLLSGYLTGYFTRYARKWILATNSLIIKALVVVVFVSYYSVFINFPVILIYYVPPMFIIALYLHKRKFKFY